MRGKELLTAEQREEFMQIPSDSDWALGTYYTFSQHDLDIINNHRRDHNRLGFAVQLAVLRFPGWSLSELKMIPNSVLSYVNGEIKETNQPRKNRLKEIYTFMQEQTKLMQAKYGENVRIKGRMVY